MVAIIITTNITIIIIIIIIIIMTFIFSRQFEKSREINKVKWTDGWTGGCRASGQVTD